MIRVRGLTVRYGDHVALAGVDLDVPAGVVQGLLGPSGSGKTTLLYALDRLHDLVPGTRVEGTVEVGGRSVAERHPDDLRREVGLILQRPVPFPMSIGENVAFPLRAHGRTEVADRVEAALRRAALWDEVRDRLKAPASALSGGQQQRLCLARALALEPRVLLLDEPCASLDPRSTALVEETLRGVAGTTTLVLVTHNLAQARRLADRCACLWPRPDGGGALVDEGPTARVFDAPATDDLRSWFAGAIG